MRVSAPPIRHPCYYGIDFPDDKQLIAAHNSVEGIRSFLGVDTLGYQTIEGLLAAVSESRDRYCLACFTGQYPVPVRENMDRLALERRT